ncbi:MAG: hypothetical protein R2849_03920 [Thermomicrobiales bacterium]
MSAAAHVGERVNYLCDQAMLAVHGTPLAAEITSIRQRMSEPLRVAIAGRVKAGNRHCSTRWSVSGWRRRTPASAPGS